MADGAHPPGRHGPAPEPFDAETFLLRLAGALARQAARRQRAAESAAQDAAPASPASP